MRHPGIAIINLEETANSDNHRPLKCSNDACRHFNPQGHSDVLLMHKLAATPARAGVVRSK